ncbi:endo-beta-N-acetylglucosaminidase [Streptomyces sp. LP05-1]|uniref:Endo-beta-N-acetylglucosaminidase n=1 Tax=Streptomyces pyxinae TaxID=2970734 RepID=A0ABT2CK14_9ACTN|nr:endo-beta-N-acetylglucosaminidase [Streptomyces sp. LP05-1]MCS0636919.1 endo-beta-N-acetylglucosaminidase [Streptomyces sp. LP05-1]
MNQSPHHPSRRTLVLGAGAATALLGLPGPAATAATAQAARAGAGAAAAPDTPPYALYWYPDSLPEGTPGTGITWRSLKSWRPADEPDLEFNRSATPLAPRFTPVAAHPSARAGQARIQSLVSFGPTSSHPAQGGPTAASYSPVHWSLLDELVFWGGSSGEGLILAPTAPVVDAAHQNGVPVLGTVFLPPVAYGGRLQWTRDLVQRDAAGGFPLAAKLVEAATVLGFDGWFINAETSGGDAALGTAMVAFVTELKRRSAAAGLRVTWYDALTVQGSVSWQGALNSRNQAFFEQADSMFLDFRWTPGTLASSADLAGRLGRDRYQLSAGVDVESGGWNTRVDWGAILPDGKPATTSYAFYRPEWTFHQLPSGAGPAEFHTADDRFWTGRSADPARPDPADPWRAPATAVADRSAVTGLPFATTFNTGHGLRWYEDGAVTSDSAWNHLGLQDQLPGRRWTVRTSGRRPEVGFDFTDAWRGGSSLLVRGAFDAPATLDLFTTRLPLPAGAVVELTHRADTGAVTVELAVATREPARPGDPVPYTCLPVATLQGGGRAGWTTSTVRLGAAGTVRALGVRLTARGGAAWRLGALMVRDGSPVRPPAAPTGLRVTGAGGGVVRLGWDAVPGARQYTVHRLLPDGGRRFLGATRQRAYAPAGLTPLPGESGVRFEVRAVGPYFTASAPATTTHPRTAGTHPDTDTHPRTDAHPHTEGRTHAR